MAKSCCQAIVNKLYQPSFSGMVFYCQTMVIAFNGLCLKNTSSGAGYYTVQLAIALGKLHPGHQFLLLADEPSDLPLPVNVRVIVNGKKVTSLLARRRWLRRTLPDALKKNNVDVFISLDGTLANTTVQQISGIADLAQLNSLPAGIRRWWQQKMLKRSIEKARAFVVPAAELQSALTHQFPAEQNKIIQILKAALPLFVPMDFSDQQMWRDDITAGKQYFFYNAGGASADAFVTVLKAFTAFKKWQQSDMKLVITGVSKNSTDHRAEKLNTYRYRDDVIALHRVSHKRLHQLYAASYAFIFLPEHEVFGVPVLEALQCGIPCITCNRIDPAVAGEAVLLTESHNNEAIAAELIRLYKDEDLRAQLITRGLQHVAGFTWEAVAAKWWSLITGGKD